MRNRGQNQRKGRIVEKKWKDNSRGKRIMLVLLKDSHSMLERTGEKDEGKKKTNVHKNHKKSDINLGIFGKTSLCIYYL
jgi:hypothetical protein